MNSFPDNKLEKLTIIPYVSRFEEILTKCYPKLTNLRHLELELTENWPIMTAHFLIFKQFVHLEVFRMERGDFDFDLLLHW